MKMVYAVVTAGLIVIGFAANTTPTARVIEGISSFGPAIGYACAAIIFFLSYSLDESSILEMQAQIAAIKLPSRHRMPLAFTAQNVVG